jgi:hypothetical protein
MGQCAACGKNILIGGVKDAEVRYCNQACRGKEFFNRFFATLEAAVAGNPDPVPAARPSALASEAEQNAALSDPISRGAGEIALSGLALAIGAAVVGLIWFIHEKVNYPFFAQTVWFVIPIGAFLCGMAAGAGFFLGIRVFNQRPGTLTYVVAGLSGLAGYVLIFGLSWWFAEFQGVKARDVVGFPQFLQAMVENQRVQFRHGGPIDLGKWGYGRFAINLAGFAMGVMGMVAIAGGKAYCARCGRYVTTVGVQTRTSSDPEATALLIAPVIANVRSGRIQEALELHAASDATDRKGFVTTKITVETCTGCGMHLGTLSAFCKSDDGIAAVPGLNFQGRTNDRVFIPG